MKLDIRSLTLHEEQKTNKALKRDEDQFIYKEDQLRTACWISDLANQFKKLFINNSDKFQLFVNISKDNSLSKINTLTSAENFQEWKITVT